MDRISCRSVCVRLSLHWLDLVAANIATKVLPLLYRSTKLALSLANGAAKWQSIVAALGRYIRRREHKSRICSEQMTTYTA